MLHGIKLERENKRIVNLFHRQNEKPSKYCPMIHTVCEPGLVYLAKGEDGSVKIGCTKDDTTLKQRLKCMVNLYKQDFTLLFTLETCCKFGLEKKIHNNLKHYHINHYAGDELFAISDAIVESIGNIKYFKGKDVIKRMPVDTLLKV